MGNPFKNLQKGTKKIVKNTKKEFKSIGKEIQKGTKQFAKDADKFLKQADKQAQQIINEIEKGIDKPTKQADKAPTQTNKPTMLAAEEPEQANNDSAELDVIYATEITKGNYSDEMIFADAVIIDEATEETILAEPDFIPGLLEASIFLAEDSNAKPLGESFEPVEFTSGN
ncbi:MAG: hypothetical protein P8P83_03420 [Rickettsiaceae bacterium]|nr:hypothetical protein [Rickettsiaceae bacterium]